MSPIVAYGVMIVRKRIGYVIAALCVFLIFSSAIVISNFHNKMSAPLHTNAFYVSSETIAGHIGKEDIVAGYPWFMLEIIGSYYEINLDKQAMQSQAAVASALENGTLERLLVSKYFVLYANEFEAFHRFYTAQYTNSTTLQLKQKLVSYGQINVIYDSGIMTLAILHR
jgi:hypothetical protein